MHLSDSYVYAALLLNKLGKEITAERMVDVLTATGMTVDTEKVRLLVSSLNGVDIAATIKDAMVAQPVKSVTPVIVDAKPEEKKKKDEDSGVDDYGIGKGLSELFG
jgi:large subunit ribosomal protein L12